MEGLQNALGFLRSEIGHRIRLRFTPEIRFYLDQTLDHAFHIEGLLNSLKNPTAAPDNQETEPKKRVSHARRVRKKKETP
jgi:ribosome-binding factor A